MPAISRCLCVVLLFAFIQSAKANSDPFKPYLKRVPSVVKIISEVNSGTGTSAITTRKFTFASRDGRDTVYAIMAFPQQPGVYPGIMFLHGGGSKAEDMLHRVEDYAREGYVTMAFDMPGICNSTTTPNSTGAWKSKPGGETPRFDIASSVENSTLVDAEVAGLQAFNYLTSQKNVDDKNIGITGFSWGGYSTTMLAGLLGNRIKAAYAVFGCGFYDQGSFWVKIISALPSKERNTWLKYFDAGRRAGHIKAPYFLDAASNDTYFWPEAVTNTLAAISGNKNHLWGPNYNHRQMPNGGNMQHLYFNYYLKGIGKPFGEASIVTDKLQRDSSRKIVIKVDMPAGVAPDSVLLYYCERNTTWQLRKWIPIESKKRTDQLYDVIIPAELVKKGIDYYGYITDDRKVAVSTAMYYQSTQVIH
jgi:dienelactone hydrolase